MEHARLAGPTRAGRAALLAAALLCTPAAQAAYAGLWFQCQPRWAAEKNYLLVDVKRGDAAWSATWGIGNSAGGKAQADPQGNLMLRGCHSISGKPKACDAARPPVFAVLPKAAAEGPAPPVDAALRRGGWIRTDQRGSERLAQQCAELRPKSRG